MIRDVREVDFEAIAAIYNHYVLHSVATFEEAAIDTKEVQKRVEKVISQNYWWIVAEDGEEVVGYAYASRWNERAAYRSTVELSVYLAPAAAGRGHGTRLYEELFERVRGRGLHVVVAGISLPNPASERLHEKFGMEKVAHFAEVGHKLGRWVDVGYWQVKLNASQT